MRKSECAKKCYSEPIIGVCFISCAAVYAVGLIFFYQISNYGLEYDLSNE